MTYFLRPFFIEELSIYVARQSGIRSLNINKALTAKNSKVLMTLSGAVLRARLRKAESYILWLHSPYTPARSFFIRTNRLASRLNPTYGCLRLFISLICTKEVFFYGLENLWRSLPTSRSRRPGGKHEEDSKTIRS